MESVGTRWERDPAPIHHDFGDLTSLDGPGAARREACDATGSTPVPSRLGVYDGGHMILESTGGHEVLRPSNCLGHPARSHA